jgi:hypothetical protein
MLCVIILIFYLFIEKDNIKVMFFQDNLIKNIIGMMYIDKFNKSL